MRTKDIIEVKPLFTEKPKVTHLPRDYKMDYDLIVDKPFLVTVTNWATTNTQFTELARHAFPTAAITNPTITAPFSTSTFNQLRMCALLQVSGTPTHQGLILAAAIPHGSPTIENPNQVLCAPHVFLNASEATSVCLELPFYSPATLRRNNVPGLIADDTQVEYSSYGSDVCDLVLFVMDPLTTATGSASALSVSIHAVFKDAEFYVPRVASMEWQPQCGSRLSKMRGKAKVLRESKIGGECVCSTDYKSEAGASFLNSLWRLPTTLLDETAKGLKTVAGDLIDYGRSTIRSLTGFHNPNDPVINHRVIVGHRNFQNNVDVTTKFEKLDNHALFTRVYDDYYFRTKQDEMDVNYLTSKPVYVGKFKITSSTAAGKNLFSYPMTPMVEASATGKVATTSYYSMLRTLYENSRYWRGGLKLHIQAVCTSFHFAKIIILKQYAVNGGMIHDDAAYVPRYDQIHNMNTDTLEFSAGGQIQTIDLPFCSNFRQLECTKDFVLNAVNHGVVYGYLVQPLVYNSNVPTSVTFNVYISGGDDLEFSGYATDNITIAKTSIPAYSTLTTASGVSYDYIVDKPDNSMLLGKSPLEVFIPGTLGDKEKAKRLKILKRRRARLWVQKPEFVTPEEGDDWDTLGYVTKNTVETLRNLNADTHNYKSAKYSMIKGPLIQVTDKIKYKKPWEEDKTGIVSSGWKIESGVETLVSPSTQEPLLTKPEPYNDLALMSFQPNKSIRDYVRFMYPQKPIVSNLTPTSPAESIVPIRIFDLISNYNSDCDALQAFTSHFLGVAGGFKIRLKIVGANAASLLYAPPSTFVFNQTNSLISPTPALLPTDAAALEQFKKAVGFSVKEKQYPLPQIDTAIGFNYSGSSANIGSSSQKVITLEFEIPNMNMHNYVGSAAKYAGICDAENDFGTIYVCLVHAVDYNSGYANYVVQPFVGLSDESRLGFQCYSPKKTINTYVPTAPTGALCRQSPYSRSYLSGFPPGIPVNPLPVFSSTYFFNTV